MALTKPNTDQPIEALLGLCRDGNQLAQLEVYNRYQKAMYNTAFRIVKDSLEAEDVMQESFIAAFNKLDTFKGDATFGSWLKRIVVNNSIAQYKKNKRFTDVSVDQLRETVEESSSLTEADYSQVKVAAVMEGLSALKDNYRQVLSLHLIAGYDHEEICEIMKISYGNCRTMISRAKESLRQKLSV